MNSQSNSKDLVGKGSWRVRLAVFLGGGLFISLGDRVHINYGILTQNDHSFFGQAWWVVPTFGVVSVVLLEGWRALRRYYDEAPAEPSLRRLLWSALLFQAAYASSGPFDAWGPWLAVILTLLWLPRITFGFTRARLTLCLLLALLGPLGEALQAATGIFSYDHPDWGPVPSWLFPIYLHGALVVPELEAFFARNATRRAA